MNKRIVFFTVLLVAIFQFVIIGYLGCQGAFLLIGLFFFISLVIGSLLRAGSDQKKIRSIGLGIVIGTLSVMVVSIGLVLFVFKFVPEL